MIGGTEKGNARFARQLERLSLTARFRFTARAFFLRHGCGWTWRAKPLPCYDFWLALEGRAFLQVDGQEHAVWPGTAFLLPPGYQPRGRHAPGHSLSNFFCRFHLLDAAGRRLPASRLRWPAGPFQFEDLPHVLEAAHDMERGLRSGTGPGVRQAELALWQILFECALTGQPPLPDAAEDPRIERVRKAVLGNPEKPWTVKSMARLAGLSHTQFARLFLRQVTVAPKRYLLQQRIERACVLLKETDLSLALVAENAGYKNEYFFSRQFKQFTGTSPGAYRRRWTANLLTPPWAAAKQKRPLEAPRQNRRR